MIKNFLGAAALAAVAVSAAPAQSVFHYNGGGGTDAFNSRYGQFKFNTQPSTGNFGTSAFKVWCVDQAHTISDNASTDYLVTVTRLNSNAATMTANTRADNADTYAHAAVLADAMDGDNAGGIKTKQYAIWAIIHGKTGMECRIFDGDLSASNGNTSGCVAGDVVTQVGYANAHWTDIDKSQWYVITGKDGCGPGDTASWPLCGIFSGDEKYTSSGMQELLARCVEVPTIQQEGSNNVCANDGFEPGDEEGPAPEPATMSLVAMGLAGMAGTSLRRRRNKK